MQAITTKFVAPTNTKGTRISAKCVAGTITVPYEYAGSEEDAHKIAAYALVKKLGWDKDNCGKLATGQQHNGNYVHVFTGGL